MNNKIKNKRKREREFESYFNIRNVEQLNILGSILSIQDACSFLGIGRTCFKKECRKMGLSQWPNKNNKIPISEDVILPLVLLMFSHDN